jgi:manganese-dependent inorganic pyrophosphatase
MQLQGQDRAVAARQGVLRRETAYILERFAVPAPRLVTDVRPRVADVMRSPVTTAHLDRSVHEVGQVLQREESRVVPVVDDDGRLAGVMGVEDFARNLIAGLDTGQMDEVPLDLNNVLRALDGRLLVHVPGRELHDRVMVGAMEISSMLKRLAPDILLVIGDRADAQRAAIEFGVGALVITGDLPVEEDVLALAREKQVTVISVPHHTSTTVRLIHLSTAVRHLMRRTVITCKPDDTLEDVAEILREGRVRSLVVIDDERRVVGMVSRTSLLSPVHRQIVLVDHNERGQAVTGIEEAEVIGVIDHHRVADFQTRAPLFMRLEPVGATSTIVGKLFAEADVEVPPEVAGVLLGGILADTLLFRGPTTTHEDRRVAAELAARAGVEMEEYGMSILNLASDVSDLSPEQLLTTDFKEFSVEGSHFGIGVIETTNGADVLARRDELLRAMARLRERGYTSVLFAVIDILRERTTILIDGHEAEVAETFGAELKDAHTIELEGIMSRKKHIVPKLGEVDRKIGGR